MNFIKYIFLFLVLLFGVENIFACMCVSTSVCEAYANADAIVVATVKHYESAKVPIDIIFPDGKTDDFEEGQEVSLKVNKTYKGKNFDKIKLLQPNSSCDWVFSNKHLDKEYLLYLVYSNKYKKYRITMCGRSSPIESASDDLSWLDGLPKSLTRTRISGGVNINDETNTFPALPNLHLQIRGSNKNYSVTSDINGLYEIWDLPIGKYSVIPNIPLTYQLAWTSSTPDNWIYFWNPDKDFKALEVTLNKNSCGGVEFMFEKKKDEK